jgi:hypothetical protein
MDYTKGTPWGLTWTIDSKTSNLFISFLAIWVTFVGASLWKLCAFLLHRYLSRKPPGPGIQHQIQLVLRNTSSPLEVAIELYRVAQAWRHVLELHQRSWAYFIASVAIGTFVLVSVGGLFSSNLSNGDARANDVRIEPYNCGHPNPDRMASWIADTARNAQEYARDCYGTAGASNSARCASFIQTNIS